MKTGLFRAIKKRLSLVRDNDMGAFRDKLNVIVEQKDSLSDEEIAAKVDELKTLLADLPESEDKAKLDRFLDDFALVKGQDAKVATEAAGEIADLYEKLDTEAMKDVPAAEPAEEETTEEVEETEAVKEAGDADGAEEEATEEAKETVEETEAPEGTEDTDADNAEYTLEEIYQFIKKRMAEDAEADAGEGEKETTDETVGEWVKQTMNDGDEEVEEEKEAEVVTDGAPFIPVTMNKAIAGKTSAIEEMFNKIKNGGR